MKKQAMSMRYFFLISLCCMQIGGSSSSVTMSVSPYARLYAILQSNKRSWVPAAALLFLGTAAAAWYFWPKPKSPAVPTEYIPFPTISQNRLTKKRRIDRAAVYGIFNEQKAAIDGINTMLDLYKMGIKQAWFTDAFTIIDEGDDDLIKQLWDWLDQFKKLLPDREDEIQQLITDLMNFEKTSSESSFATSPSQLQTSTSSSIAPSVTVPTTLKDFPTIIPRNKQGTNLTTKRGITRDQVDKALSSTHEGVSSIDTILQQYGKESLKQTFGAKIHTIVNEGSLELTRALSEWLRQFKDFYSEDFDKKAIDNLIVGLENIPPEQQLK